ncbi:hypothetical protein KVT40_005506 [Elsinoe batatas]|uniref:Uncharacterized protein n=1 Tax=Elsinoe batatas TaxID=2601811 RepID=A0A8K0KYM0_9PEZI|nr:hypothetical protein KVT40_005506 [Elsinoe batatas]
MPPYEYNGPVDCETEIKAEGLRAKTAIVTGGANGLGEAYVRALQCLVVIGDLDAAKGRQLEQELSGVRFVKCNTTVWEKQRALFREAASLSWDGRISYVVAIAGVARKDEVFEHDSMSDEPSKPDLTTIDINIKGSLFMAKLAPHYFLKQNGEESSSSQQDTCLVLVGSGAAFLDCPRGPQYQASKWAMRGVMHSLRRTTHYYGSRVNLISPWYVKTNILSEEAFQHVKDVGVEFATVEDAGRCLLRILGDATVNSHQSFISARKWAPLGFIDLEIDDYSGNDLLQEIQADQIRPAPIEDGLYGKSSYGYRHHEGMCKSGSRPSDFKTHKF